MKRNITKICGETQKENPSKRRITGDQKCYYHDKMNCKETFNMVGEVENHTNIESKVTATWYHCISCKLNIMSKKLMKDHILEIHKCEIPLKEVEKLMVKDLQEIQWLNEIHATAIQNEDLNISSNLAPVHSPQFKPDENIKSKQNFKYDGKKVGVRLDNKHPEGIESNNWPDGNKTVTDSSANEEAEGQPIKNKEEINQLRHGSMDEFRNETIAEMIGKDKQFEASSPRSSFIPLEYSEFKPIKDRYTCQYCGFKNKESRYVKTHVNIQHELTTWYRCFFCNGAFTSTANTLSHMRRVHKKTITSQMVREQLIEDKEEIDRLRNSKIKSMFVPKPVTINKKEWEMFDKLNDDSKQLRYIGGNLFMPVEYSEFKPIKDRHTCQYCGHKSKSPMKNIYHINTQHEMTTWYKCSNCTEMFIRVEHMQNHMESVHKRKITLQIVREHQITDREVINRLRNDRIKYHQNLTPKPVTMEEFRNELITGMIGKDKQFKASYSRSSFMPLEYSEFKPIKDRYTCQYCGFKSKESHHVKTHVNIHHELITWYRCFFCNGAFTSTSNTLSHIRRFHKKTITSQMVREQLIEDKEEIDRLRNAKIKSMFVPKPVAINKNEWEMFDKLNDDSKQLRYIGGNLFMPVEYSEFKPNEDRHTCQYCGRKSKNPMKNIYHINSQHEMTTWYKCFNCTDVFIRVDRMQKHMESVHKRKITFQILREHQITDREVINRLRNDRINKHLQNYIPKPVTMDEIGNETTAEMIGKVKKFKTSSSRGSFMPVEYSEFKPINDPYKCQYCGLKNKLSMNVKNHVNSQHELTTWYKCFVCNDAFACTNSIQSHMRYCHKKTISSQMVEEQLIKDKEEIDRLRNAKIKSMLMPKSVAMKKTERETFVKLEKGP